MAHEPGSPKRTGEPGRPRRGPTPFLDALASGAVALAGVLTYALVLLLAEPAEPCHLAPVTVATEEVVAP